MPELVGPDEIKRSAQAALELDGVDDVEVVVMHEWGGTTRFASSQIHQSTAREDTDVRVRVATGGRIGVASSNDLSPEGTLAAALSAKEMAGVVGPDPLWPGLAPASEIKSLNRFFDSVAGSTPEQRAESVASLIGTCPAGFVAAGAYETQSMEMAVANTRGQFCWEPFTQALLTTVVNGGEGGAGFAEEVAADAGGIDAAAIGETAGKKAIDSQRAVELSPSRRTVVLEPAATGTLVGFLAWVGFGGRDYIEGRSCFSGKAGMKVAVEGVSIADDALDPGMIGTPFDFEGVPRRRVELITDGAFVDAVYDLRTAKEAGRDSTGHALPSPNPDGPFPFNLSMTPGTSDVAEMIAATEDGVLVTRFHYSNVVNPVESSITGMTRDGTFMIKDGQVAGAVMNLRFTQSIIEALSNVTHIGAETELASEFFFSASRVPALRIEGFNFSGVSDH
jgi:PmbA protein